MSENRNGKREVVVAIIVCALVLAIVIGTVVMKKKNTPVEKNEKEEVEVNISYDGTELTEEEIEQEAERIFEDDYTSTEVFLGMMGLRKTGKKFLYCNEDSKIDFSLLLYESEELANEKFKESTEKINIDGTDYTLFETGIKFEDYKAELLKYMESSIFEKYFTTFAKEINGMLYITNEAEDEYSLDSFEKIDEEAYIINYLENGENKEAEIKIDKTQRLITEINM